MEMQNVLSQMTEMLSTNGSNDLLSKKTTANNMMGTQFHSIMSSELSKSSGATQSTQSVKKDTANTAGVQTVNEKRQQELETSVNQAQQTQKEKEDLGSKDVLSVENGEVVQETSEDVITSEEMEAVVQWMGLLQQEICQVLSITLEELEGVMETLGLQLSDLQNMGNVQQLVLAISGEDNVAMLLTNEELATQVQDIVQTVEELTQEMAQQLEIPKEEFTQVLDHVQMEMKEPKNKLEQGDPDVGIVESVKQQGVKTEEKVVEFVKEQTKPVWEKEVLSDAESKEKSAETMEQALEQPLEAEVIVTETEKQQQEMVIPTTEEANVTQVEEKVTGQVNEDASDVDIKQVDAEKVHVSLEKEADDNMNNSSSENEFLKDEGQETSHTSVMEQVMNSMSNVKAQFAENIQDKVQLTQQMQEIFEQVVEQVKVTVTADTSEMEVQLNPEHLGKVNLTVVAKEGHITAQFVTENEVTRQALEGQIQQLRETLVEQGLKVDEVEVSVSDFNFQEGNQANAEEQKQQQRDEHAKQVQRNLNLANLDDLSDMTEAEELAVKIMQSNGNQIDYTA